MHCSSALGRAREVPLLCPASVLRERKPLRSVGVATPRYCASIVEPGAGAEGDKSGRGNAGRFICPRPPSGLGASIIIQPQNPWQVKKKLEGSGRLIRPRLENARVDKWLQVYDLRQNARHVHADVKERSAFFFRGMIPRRPPFTSIVVVPSQPDFPGSVANLKRSRVALFFGHPCQSVATFPFCVTDRPAIG